MLKLLYSEFLKCLEIFESDYPKMVKFIKKVRRDALKEGTVVEINVTGFEGKEYSANMRITSNDAETVDIVFK